MDSVLEIPDARFGRKNHLCYAPDGSRLLVDDKIVIDGTTHAVLFTIPSRQEPDYGAFADADHVVQIFKVNRQWFFDSSAIPRDLAEKTVTAVKNGGKSEDGGLQPLTPADVPSIAARSSRISTFHRRRGSSSRFPRRRR